MAERSFRLAPDNRELIMSLRTGFATVISLLLARALKLPEFYWAPISTIVVLLSTIDPLTLAWQRFVGTALGAAVGALIASWLPPNWAVYGLGIVGCGVLSSILRLHYAYRFTAITFTIVLLIRHTAAPWIVAVHRFVEVSLGIAVALAVALIWRVPTPKPA
jgi:uncharacterized membrane protein YccC